jgi:hypothetical protein
MKRYRYLRNGLGEIEKIPLIAILVSKIKEVKLIKWIYVKKVYIDFI